MHVSKYLRLRKWIKKYSQNCPRMVLKWFQNGPEMVPGWGQKGFGIEFGVGNASLTGSDTTTPPILDSKLSKNATKMVPKRSGNGSWVGSEGVWSRAWRRERLLDQVRHQNSIHFRSKTTPKSAQMLSKIEKKSIPKPILNSIPIF